MLHQSSSNARPDLARLFDEAHAAHQRGALVQAERLYKAILENDPKHFDVLHLLGFLNYQRGCMSAALEFLASALQINDQSAEVWSNQGLVHHAMGCFQCALASYTTALKLEPQNPDLLNKCGIALLDLDKAQDAINTLNHALAIKPDLIEALGNRGNALIRLNRPYDAIADYDTARRLAGDSARLLTNRAHALRRLDQPQTAISDLERAIALDPQFPEAHFELGLARLTLGDFARGWEEYEWRWKTAAFASDRRELTCHQWNGDQPLSGKTILLHAEQGYGDTIQFVRYATRVGQLGARVVLEVPPALMGLVAHIEGLGSVVRRGDALPYFDLHCPLLSLPRAFKTNATSIPAAVPYIRVRATRAATRMHLSSDKPLIGVAWAGRKSHRNDINRSIALTDFLSLLDTTSVQFVSLQRELDGHAEALLRKRGVINIANDLEDFADTAALMSQLDLIITVDTAVAHLAGALGKPVYVLLPFAADFRWLRQRDNSPWYPTARLFRQSKFADWKGVIAEIRAQLP